VRRRDVAAALEEWGGEEEEANEADEAEEEEDGFAGLLTLWAVEEDVVVWRWLLSRCFRSSSR
jgi:hypothetical protein